jgi:hypothetical protein
VSSAITHDNDGTVEKRPLMEALREWLLLFIEHLANNMTDADPSARPTAAASFCHVHATIKEETCDCV